MIGRLGPTERWTTPEKAKLFAFGLQTSEKTLYQVVLLDENFSDKKIKCLFLCLIQN